MAPVALLASAQGLVAATAPNWDTAYKYWPTPRDLKIYATVLPCMANAADMGEGGGPKSCAVGTMLLSAGATDNGLADLVRFLLGWLLLPSSVLAGEPASRDNYRITLKTVADLQEQIANEGLRVLDRVPCGGAHRHGQPVFAQADPSGTESGRTARRHAALAGVDVRIRFHRWNPSEPCAVGRREADDANVRGGRRTFAESTVSTSLRARCLKSKPCFRTTASCPRLMGRLRPTCPSTTRESP